MTSATDGNRTQISAFAFGAFALNSRIGDSKILKIFVPVYVHHLYGTRAEVKSGYAGRRKLKRTQVGHRVVNASSQTSTATASGAVPSTTEGILIPPEQMMKDDGAITFDGIAFHVVGVEAVKYKCAERS